MISQSYKVGQILIGYRIPITHYPLPITQKSTSSSRSAIIQFVQSGSQLPQLIRQVQLAWRHGTGSLLKGQLYDPQF